MSRKTDHLTRLAEALPGSLHLFETDLLKEGSFDEAVRGVWRILRAVHCSILFQIRCCKIYFVFGSGAWESDRCDICQQIETQDDF